MSRVSDEGLLLLVALLHRLHYLFGKQKHQNRHCDHSAQRNHYAVNQERAEGIDTAAAVEENNQCVAVILSTEVSVIRQKAACSAVLPHLQGILLRCVGVNG